MSIVLETAARVVVFDTGPRYSAEADAAGRVLVPYLRARGIARVDILVVSHPDIDHAGGAVTLLHSLPVQQVWTSLEAGSPLLRGAEQMLPCKAGQTLQLGSLSLAAPSPPASLYAAAKASTSSRSCVVMAALGSHRVLLTGDVPARQEREMVRAANDSAERLRVDLLVAPHHGSRSSSSEELIAATAPRWVSMQLGYRNHFGHPHPIVLARYRAYGVAIVRSDQSGAAQWRFAPDGAVELERWRIDHARYWHNQPVRAMQQTGDAEASDGAAGGS